MKEKDFIQELKNESRHAYSKLITAYEQKVFATCLSFVPNTEDAKDIAQDVFLEVFKSINKFKGNSKLSTWIYRITTNKCLAFIRKKNTKKRFAFVQSITGGNLPIDKTLHYTEFKHPGILLEHKEHAEILFNAINALPVEQKLAFTLNKVEGLTYTEVCEIMGKSLASVESLLFRAKKNLQKTLHTFYKKNYK